MVHGSGFLNHCYAFGIKLAGAGCETQRCHLLWLFLDSGTLVQKANAWILNISPTFFFFK